MKVSKFEDLVAWQKARIMTKRIYRITKESGFEKDYGLASQIQRASVSIMANLAEGFERDSIKEFLRYVIVAKSSCAEVRSHLIVAYDIGYLPENNFREIEELALEVSRIIGGLRTSLFKKILSEKQS
jgi:four helix bundle protein